MFVPPDSWALTVMAWMKKPSTIPKVIGVEIPVQEPGLYYLSPPRSLRESWTKGSSDNQTIYLSRTVGL